MSNDATQTTQSTTAAATTDDATTKLNHQVEINRNLQARLTHYEKTFEGVNVEKLKADSAELQRVLENSKDPAALDQVKKRLEDTYKETLTTKDKTIQDQQKLIKNLRVTTTAMKLHSSFFVDKSESVIQDMIDRHADWDDKAGRIVVKDSNGQPRYSPTKGGELMSVEEYFTELSTQMPFLAKGKNNTGTMTGQQNNVGGSNAAGFAAPANGFKTVADAREFFRGNPDAMAAYINGTMKA